MSERVRKLFQTLGQHRRAAVLTLLAVMGFLSVGASLAARHLEATGRYRAAQQALEQRDYARARANLTLCLRIWPRRTEVHCLAARAARRDGDYKAAARHLDECRNLAGGDEAALLEDALLHAEQGDLVSVEAYLRNRLQQDNDDIPLILEALARGYARTYRLTQALTCAGQWVQRQPGNAQALLQRGLIWDQLFSPKDALEDYLRAVDLDPEFDEARLHLAEHLLQTGRPGEALEHFQRLGRESPRALGPLLGVACCRDELGQFQSARVLLDQLLAVDPERGAALTARGRVALHLNQPSEAERWLRQAVTVAPYDRAANYLLSQCLRQRDKREEAKIYVQRVQQIDAAARRLGEVMDQLLAKPWDLGLRLEAAQILLRSGRVQEGLDWLNGILRDAPGHRPTHQVLADYYQRTRDGRRDAHHRQLAATEK